MITNLYIFWSIKILCQVSLLTGFILLSYSGQLHFPLLRTLTAQCLAVTGGVIAVYHYALLKKVNSKVSRPDALVQQPGLFPWLRHPMYLGDALMALGLALLLGRTSFTLVALLALLALMAQAVIEDRQLDLLFGEAFGRYRKATRRMIPGIW